MSKLNRRHANVAALALAMIVTGVFSGSSFAGNKVIDWDKELAKPRQMMDTNNVEEAVKYINDKILKKHPDSAPAHCDLGKCYKKRGKLSLAKSEFRRATELDANYAESYYELGSMYQSDKEWQLAVDSFEKFLSLAPYHERKDSVKDRVNFCKSKL